MSSRSFISFLGSWWLVQPLIIYTRQSGLFDEFIISHAGITLTGDGLLWPVVFLYADCLGCLRCSRQSIRSLGCRFGEFSIWLVFRVKFHTIVVPIRISMSLAHWCLFLAAVILTFLFFFSFLDSFPWSSTESTLSSNSRAGVQEKLLRANESEASRRAKPLALLPTRQLENSLQRKEKQPIISHTSLLFSVIRKLNWFYYTVIWWSKNNFRSLFQNSLVLI